MSSRASIFLRFLTNTNFRFGKPADLGRLRDLATPAEQHGLFLKVSTALAQFMIPGSLEDRVAAGAPGMLSPLLKLGSAALASGAVNKAQGGSFGGGAAAGAGGSLIGSGLRAIAPRLAESALGIRNTDRAFGKTPGQAILNETHGFRPETIAESGQSKLNDLIPQVESMADAAGIAPRAAHCWLPAAANRRDTAGSGGRRGRRLSEPSIFNAPGRPMRTALPRARNISEIVPLVTHPGMEFAISPMAFQPHECHKRTSPVSAQI